MLNGVFKFIGFGLPFGREMRISQPARRIHFIAIIGIGFERRGGTAFLAAKFIVADIRHGAHQPGFE